MREFSGLRSRTQRRDAPLDLDDGGFNDEIVARIASHFGNIATTATKMRVPQNSLERSLARYTALLQQRAASDRSNSET